MAVSSIAAAVIGLVLLLVLILVAIRLISIKREPHEETDTVGPTAGPLIHTSGIYSIIRKSPREDLLMIRPPEAEIRKYLATINEDINELQLSHFEKIKLVDQWRKRMEENIRIVEQGDCEDVEFYYFDCTDDTECPVCARYFHRGQFVTRQELFNHPAVIPPLHLGCTSTLVPYHGKENLRETTTIGMAPLLKSADSPSLPEWTKTVKNS